MSNQNNPSKWEYKVLAGVTPQWDELGEEGWELVSVMHNAREPRLYEDTFYFKRPKIERARVFSNTGDALFIGARRSD